MFYFINTFFNQKGQKMWTGFRYAVHYTDRFIFGSNKLANTYGGFTSNYRFESQGNDLFILYILVFFLLILLILVFLVFLAFAVFIDLPFFI
jgi:hypothetical protein